MILISRVRQGVFNKRKICVRLIVCKSKVFKFRKNENKSIFEDYGFLSFDEVISED